MSGVTEQAAREGSQGRLTARAPGFTPLRCVARDGRGGFQGTKHFPGREHILEQSLELAARAARSWVDPRWSLELSADASPNERSCLERGQARYRTEVR